MSHGHHHHHGSHAAPRVRPEGWSLLRASAGERLGLAGVLLVAMWAVVLWALRS